MQNLRHRFKKINGSRIGKKHSWVIFYFLIIPVISFSQNNRVWATYLGGSIDDYGRCVALDTAGNIYTAGITASTNGIASGGFQNSLSGDYDAFLSKFDSNGNLLWSTYYGGTLYDQAYSVTTDVAGNVYLAGWTASTSGISSGGFQNIYGGGNYDAFLVKFDASGNRLWATYYGGLSTEYGYDVATDPSGNVYLSGYTSSATGIASGGFQNTFGGDIDAFIVKFDASGNRLWASYYGDIGVEIGWSVATDLTGNVYLAGQTSSNSAISSMGFQNTLGGISDGFLVKFDQLGNRLWATYYGGAGTNYGYCVATDVSGDVYLAGTTSSTSSIASGGHQNTYGGGGFDAYLVKFSGSGTRIWATYYGGSSFEHGYSIATDIWKNIYLTGFTNSGNNIASGGFQNVNSGGWDAYLVKFTDAGTQLCATFYGGNVDEVCQGVTVDKSGNVYLAGRTYSTNNISSAGAFQNTFSGALDAFLAKFTSCYLPLNVSVTPTTINCFSQCNGIAISTPSGGLGAYSYSWNTTPTQTTQSATGLCAGSYTVTVNDDIHNVFTTVVIITQPPLLTSTVSAINNVKCFGDSSGNATIAVSGGTSSYTYFWNNGSTQSSISNLSATNYTCVVTDANGCSTSSLINIMQPAAINLVLSSTPSSCGNNNGTITAVASGGVPNYNYNWSNTQSTLSQSGLSAGIYSCTVTDANNCTQSQAISITQTSSVIATATKIANGGNTQLIATGGGTYQWLPSTGLSCDTCYDPIITLSQSTDYCVLVTNTEGCSDTACVSIVIENNCGELFIPNAFSPNNDGENDVFIARGINPDYFAIMIYNRWGEMVFEANTISIEWDGIFKGKFSDTGIYTYHISYSCNGPKINKNGNISLIK